MEIAIEIITLFCQTVWLFLSETCLRLIESIPAFMELKQVLSYCTPQSALALFFGIPTIAVSLGFFLAKATFSHIRK